MRVQAGRELERMRVPRLNVQAGLTKAGRYSGAFSHFPGKRREPQVDLMVCLDDEHGHASRTNARDLEDLEVLSELRGPEDGLAYSAVLRWDVCPLVRHYYLPERRQPGVPAFLLHDFRLAPGVYSAHLTLVGPPSKLPLAKAYIGAYYGLGLVPLARTVHGWLCLSTLLPLWAVVTRETWLRCRSHGRCQYGLESTRTGR